MLQRMKIKFFGVEQKDFQIEQVPGHFNNPILLITSKLKKKNAENFIKVFFSKMKKDDFEEVFENVEDYVTQKLVSENLTMSKEDAIKINISTPVYVKNNTKKIYQELMKV